MNATRSSRILSPVSFSRSLNGFGEMVIHGWADNHTSLETSRLRVDRTAGRAMAILQLCVGDVASGSEGASALAIAHSVR
jgi:hypothetical protein